MPHNDHVSVIGVGRAARPGRVRREPVRKLWLSHGRRGGLRSIVEYREGAAPCNDYPARIVSPPRAAGCCALSMVTVGDPAQENGWLFQYRRCPWCGFTVRRILRELPDEALLGKLRRALAQSFVRNAGEAA